VVSDLRWSCKQGCFEPLAHRPLPVFQDLMRVVLAIRTGRFESSLFERIF
jgi:hypothetical protein